jgi:hypothetical protein
MYTSLSQIRPYEYCYCSSYSTAHLRERHAAHAPSRIPPTPSVDRGPISRDFALISSTRCRFDFDAHFESTDTDVHERCTRAMPPALCHSSHMQRRFLLRTIGPRHSRISPVAWPPVSRISTRRSCPADMPHTILLGTRYTTMPHSRLSGHRDTAPSGQVSISGSSIINISRSYRFRQKSLMHFAAGTPPMPTIHMRHHDLMNSSSYVSARYRSSHRQPPSHASLRTLR